MCSQRGETVSRGRTRRLRPCRPPGSRPFARTLPLPRTTTGHSIAGRGWHAPAELTRYVWITRIKVVAQNRCGPTSCDEMRRAGSTAAAARHDRANAEIRHDRRADKARPTSCVLNSPRSSRSGASVQQTIEVGVIRVRRQNAGAGLRRERPSLARAPCIDRMLPARRFAPGSPARQPRWGGTPSFVFAEPLLRSAAATAVTPRLANAPQGYTLGTKPVNTYA